MFESYWNLLTQFRRMADSVARDNRVLLRFQYSTIELMTHKHGNSRFHLLGEHLVVTAIVGRVWKRNLWENNLLTDFSFCVDVPIRMPTMALASNLNWSSYLVFLTRITWLSQQLAVHLFTFDTLPTCHISNNGITKSDGFPPTFPFLFFFLAVDSVSLSFGISFWIIGT